MRFGCFAFFLRFVKPGSAELFLNSAAFFTSSGNAADFEDKSALRRLGALLAAPALVLAAIFCFTSPAAYGQVATGFLPFSSNSGSSFDTADNANLNVHFSIPIVTKAEAAAHCAMSGQRTD